MTVYWPALGAAVAASLWSGPALLVAQPNAPPSARTTAPPAAVQRANVEPELPFEQMAGRAYEDLGLWREAEQQYLAAGKSAKGAAAKEMAACVQRVRSRLLEAADSADLRSARIYEQRELWKEAREKYAAATQDPSAKVREAASQGLERVAAREKGFWQARLDAIDRTLATLVRLVALGIGVFLIWAVAGQLRRAGKRVELRPFESASDDPIPKQIPVLFPLLRAKLKTYLGKDTRWRGGLGALTDVPMLAVPDWPEETVEGDVTLGAVKVPMQALTKLLNRPGVSIRGGVYVAGNSKALYAEIWQRKPWRPWYQSPTVVTRIFPLNEADKELEIFVCELLLKTYVTA